MINELTTPTPGANSNSSGDRTLNSKHYQHLIEVRKIPATWAIANCWSVTIEKASELLGYQAHSSCIALQGDGTQIQVRPDKPWKATEGEESKKKAPKYRSPLGDYDAMLPTYPEDKLFWRNWEALKKQCIDINGKLYIVITEGFFKAIVGCAHGIATVALLGVEMGLTSSKDDPQGKRYLVKTLERLAKAGFNFIIAFDADCATNKYVLKAEKTLTFWLKKLKVDVLSVTGAWTAGANGETKGMDDFIKHEGIEAFRKILLNAYERNWDEEEPPKEQPLSNLQKSLAIVRERLGGRIRFNELKKQIEIDKEPIDLDLLRIDLAEETGLDISKEDAIAITTKLARQNSYHPVREYLDRVYSECGANLVSLDDLADTFFGTAKTLYRTYLKRHLIGSVARVYQPGCKMDTALFLSGAQGINKSTFFRTLYGEGWFDDTMTSASDKDELLKLHSHWCVEWAELENVFGRKNISAVKAFMSTQIDNFRTPYGRQTKAFPRTSVLVGSTNQDEFLTDPTGHRRFWVIPVVKKEIDLGLVREMRDRIWASAVAAYKAGVQWWLTQEESTISEAENKTYELSDTWEDYISEYLRGKVWATTSEILAESKLAVEPGKQDKSSQMRVAKILRQMGWKQDGRRGRTQRLWMAPKTFDVAPTSAPTFEVDTKVGAVSNACSEAIPENCTNLTNLDRKLPPENIEKEKIFLAQEEKVSEPFQGKVGATPESRQEKGFSSAPTSAPTFDDLAGWAERHSQKAYPNPKSDNVRSSQKRALAIRAAYRAANCQADLSRLKNTEGGEYSEAEIKWVNAWIKKYHPAEYARMTEVAQTVQGSLLDVN
jgi:predicted P-loop ATPase